MFRAQEQASGAAPTPIIALTASAMLGERNLCLAAGMDKVLTKPLRLDDLRSILRRYSLRRSD